MEDNKKFNLKKIGQSFSEKAKSGLEAAKETAQKAKGSITATAESFINSIDQTGDGKFNFDDIVELRRQRQEKERQAKLRHDLDALNPVFARDLSEGSFFLSKMIRITEMDKRHAASLACKDSIGHETLIKDLRIVTVYPNQSDEWGLRFYPDKNQEFYYVNPVDPKLYIAIDYFFDYMRQARVGELQRIAQKLGASYFKVTIKERKKTLYKKAASEKIAGKVGKITGPKEEAGISVSSNEFSDGEIAAETHFQGKEPTRPNLDYYKNEPQIQTLIEMRLNHMDNALKEQHLSLQCSHSSGITEKVAASIDAAFSAMKITGNTTFTSEAQNEIRQVFEYDIVF